MFTITSHHPLLRRFRRIAFMLTAPAAVALGFAAGPLAPLASATTQSQAIVNAAASMHGKPYCWDGGNQAGPTHGDGDLGYGGCSGHTKGFDCSGLALYAVFQVTGILLPHGRGMQAGHDGQLIRNQSELQPGDLVFFGGGSLAHFDHVGIYAGDAKIWDADDFNVPVQEHTLRWVEHGLPFDGGVRYWHAESPAPASTSPAPTGGEPAPTAPTPESAPPPPGSEAPIPSPPSAAPTYIETTGGVTHTWTNYGNAGGVEGPSIPSNASVAIACKVSGFRVSDGNTWWYEIASSPWSNAYYASADAFYNNGETSGSLVGTPFVDPAVPNC